MDLLDLSMVLPLPYLTVTHGKFIRIKWDDPLFHDLHIIITYNPKKTTTGKIKKPPPRQGAKA